MNNLLNTFLLFARVVAILLFATLASASFSDELDVDGDPALTSSVNTSWAPDEPMPSKFDWLMLVSGEWLKGELLSLYNDAVEFDSDQLDTLTIDWDDVSVIKTKNEKELLFNDRTILYGKVLVKQSSVTVISTLKSHEKDRASLISIGDRATNLLSQWDGNINLSVDLREGNLSQQDYTLKFNAQRRTAKTRFMASFLGSYGELENITTENNKRLTLSVDWFISNRWFLRPVQFEYFSDEFQSIDSRFTYTTAIGYHIIDRKGVSWDAYVGPGYQVTNYDRDDIDDDVDYRQETAVGSLGTQFDWDITGDIEMDAKYDLQIVSEASGKLNHHGEIGLSIDFLGDFYLDLRYILDYVEQPVPNSDNETPEKLDTSVIVGLGYDF